MPNQLQSNAMVWLYFTDDAIAKKGKCLYCNQLISYEKSTFSNLTRHLKRKHPEVLGNVSKNHLHYVWNHYTKEPEMKAKCMYCQSCISCPHNSVSNMIRHMKYKHPSIPLVNHVEFIQQEEERLYDEQDSLPDAMEETFKEPELEMESNDDRKIHQHDQEVIEEIVHDTQSQLYVDINSSIEMNSSSQSLSRTVNRAYKRPRQEAKQEAAEQEAAFEINQHHDMIPNATIRTNEGAIGRHNYFNAMQDAPVRSVSFAANIALELENLQSMQRIVAEKLISDVLFHAKLENLTEHSMILAKLS